MLRDISAEEFSKLGSNAQKKYIARLLIRGSKAAPVPKTLPPVAIIMAGIPGAGKTEFLDYMSEDLNKIFVIAKFVRIDLDEIVTIYPDYTPKTYSKFRSSASNVLALTIDVCRHGRYNMMIDGTFSGSSKVSINNVERLLAADYAVVMIYMYDVPETSWRYTQAREIETNRGINKNEFIRSCSNLSTNLRIAKSKFEANSAFKLAVVRQKVLRDKDYIFITDSDDIDSIIEQGYNIDKLKETL